MTLGKSQARAYISIRRDDLLGSIKRAIRFAKKTIGNIRLNFLTVSLLSSIQMIHLIL